MNNAIKFLNWKIQSTQKGKLSKISYKDKVFIEEINFFHKGGLISGPVKEIIDKNYLRHLPLNFHQVEKIASFKHFFQKKYFAKTSLKFAYQTGDIYLFESIEIKESYLLFSLKIKTNQDYYNDVNPTIILGQNTTSFFKTQKKKRQIYKSKIDALKSVHLDKNMPLLVNYFDNNEESSFLIRTSLPYVKIIKKKLSFRPLMEGSPKNILRQWKMRSKIAYTISFLIQINEKKSQKIIS